MPAAAAPGVDYDGGWTEYALAEHHTLVALPDDLPFEQAAIMPDAVSTPPSACGDNNYRVTTGHGSVTWNGSSPWPGTTGWAGAAR